MIEEEMDQFIVLVRVQSKNINKIVLRAKKYPDRFTVDDEQMLMELADGCRRVVMCLRNARKTKQW